VQEDSQQRDVQQNDGGHAAQVLLLVHGCSLVVGGIAMCWKYTILQNSKIKEIFAQ
jgi:hypothetical protein